jgi:hypothetical protein
MHRAYDLAQATSYIFAGAYPHFLEVDQIDFKKPVDIGDLVRLKSRVVCTCICIHKYVSIYLYAYIYRYYFYV